MERKRWVDKATTGWCHQIFLCLARWTWLLGSMTRWQKTRRAVGVACLLWRQGGSEPTSPTTRHRPSPISLQVLATLPTKDGNGRQDNRNSELICPTVE